MKRSLLVFSCIAFLLSRILDAHAQVTPLITTSPVNGHITACVGVPSLSPAIEQFIVTGTALNENVSVKAPTGFEVSLSADGGYSNSVTIDQTAGTVNSVVFVRSAAAAVAASISGNVAISSGTALANVAVTGIIRPLPSITQIAPKQYNNGDVVPGINFSGSAGVYNWTNDRPDIGLAANGSGSLSSFTAINTTNTPITATITAMPYFAGFAYVPSTGSNTVSVINTATNKQVASIPTGQQSALGSAVSPDGCRVYVTNYLSNSVSVINTANNTIITNIAVGNNPKWVAVSPDGSKVYVVNFTDGTISVIAAASNSVIKTFSVGGSPNGLAVSPDGGKLYVVLTDALKMAVINTATYATVASVPVKASPFGIALNPSGTRVYVANQDDNSVTVINTANNTVLQTVKVGIDPRCIAVSPDGLKVYVVNAGDPSYSIIDAATNALLGKIPLDVAYPAGVSVTPDGSELYIVSEQSYTVDIISTTTNTVITRSDAGINPVSVGNFISGGSNCTGAPMSFKITIDPTKIVGTISSGPFTGSIAACVGSPSVSPNIGQFTVSGANLSAGVVATAPAGFELSLNGAIYTSAVTIPQSGGYVNAVPVYVRASALATLGDISGNVTLTSGTVSQTVAVYGTISDLPIVDQVDSQVKIAGQLTDLIHFTGKGNRYIWTNDTPVIGLYGTGVGDIPPFTTVNKTTSPIVATITVMPSAPSYAYIANAIDGTVSIVYIATGTIASTIPVGKSPFGVSANSDGSRVYIVNKASNDVSVINTATNKEIARIPVGRSPYCDAVSPDGSRLYVTNYLDNSISVINTSANIVMNTIPVAKSPYAVRISPDGTLIYVTSEDPAALSVINTATGGLVKYIPFVDENSVFGLSVSHDGKSIYVAGAVSNSNQGNISVISAATNSVVSNIAVDAGPSGICISPDSKRLYVACQTAGTVMSISTLTNKAVTRISNLDSPFGVSVTPDGGQLYVTGALHSVSVISTLTSKVTGQVATGAGTDSFGNFIPNISGCSGNAVTFNITVEPPPIPAITITGTLDTLKTVYGMPSTTTTFTVSGTYITQGISIIPPSGYEVSADNSHFGSTVTLGGNGTVPPTAVWIRIAAITHAGQYPGVVIAVNGGAKNLSFRIAGEVTPAPLLITADNTSKMLGTYNPVFTATYTGFKNSDGPDQLVTKPELTTTATQYSPLGQYPLSIGGASSPDYTISYMPGVLSIIPVSPLVVPNAFTPNGDGTNDTWVIKSLLPYPNCTVYVYNRWGENVYSSIGYGVPWDGTYKGKILPFGTYYYIIDPRDGLSATAGYVAIIR